jgi:hypothetical protein
VILYRYEESLGMTSVQLNLYEFTVIKETELSYQVRIPFSEKKRWIRKNGKKKYACETKEDAMISFKRRKQRQIAILESQLERAKTALKLNSDKQIGYIHEINIYEQ